MMENMSAAQLTTRRLACGPRPAHGGIVNPEGSLLPFILFCSAKRTHTVYCSRIIQQHDS